jgi:hypothetical protein
LAPQVIGESTLIHDPISAVFHDERYMFVHALAGGVERTKVVELDETIPAPMAAPIADIPVLDVDRGTHPPLYRAHISELVLISGSVYGRVHTSSTGDLFVDTIDASNPVAPSLLASRKLSARPGILASTTITYSGHELFFCANTSATQPEQQLVSVDVSDPLQPQDLVLLGESACAQPSSVARGSVWMTWNNESANGHWRVFRVEAGGVTRLQDHSFATRGAHNYGAISSIHLDGRRALIALENTRYSFAIDFESSDTTHSLVTHSGVFPERVFAVHNRIAYFEDDGELRALDLQDVSAPVLLPYREPIPDGVHYGRGLAVSDRHLALVGVNGAMGIMALSDPIEPIEVRAQGTLDRIRRQPGGLLAYSRRTQAFIEDDHLIGGDLATAPVTYPVVAAHPVLIDGPAGPLGLFLPRIFDELFPCGGTAECEYRTGFSVFGPAIELFRPPLSPTSLPISWHPFVRNFRGAAIEGCTGVAPLEGHIHVLDRCGGSLASVGEVEVPSPWNASNSSRSFIHENGSYASVLDDRAALLVDLRVPGQPVIVAAVAISDPISAAYDDGRWVLTAYNFARGPFQAELTVYAVRPNGAILESNSDLSSDETFLGRILGMRDPLVLIAADRFGRDLRIFDASTVPPRVLHEVQLPTTPFDLVLENETAFVARLDGITVLSPICY